MIEEYTEFTRRQREFEEVFARKDYALARAIISRMNTIRDSEEEMAKKSIYYYLALL